MKKNLFLVLILLLCLQLTACGGGNSNSLPPSDDFIQPDQTPPAESEVSLPESGPAVEEDPEIAQALRDYTAGAGITDSGKCPYGDDVTWTLYNNGTLVFNGQGSIGDTPLEDPPWLAYKDVIKNVIVGTGVTRLGRFTLGYSEYLENLFLPSTLTSIGSNSISINAVNEMPWNALNIPYGVTSIDASAFSWCTAMKSVTIPDSVTSIGSGAFGGCIRLREITIPGSVAVVSDHMFSNCDNLSKVTLEEGVTTIGEFAFNGAGLTELHLPSTLTTIGAHAFSASTPRNTLYIKDVYYNGTEEQWNAIAIDNTDDYANDYNTWNDNRALLNATIHFNTP